MSNKLKIGIDINEILRARWLQFDRYYADEFGAEEMVSKYVYDFFGEYYWEDLVEVEKELKEPEDMPENINPIEYQVDERFGEAPADAFLFKAPIKKHLTAKEVYNRFMYEDFVFEIHGTAPMMYKNMDLDVNKFQDKYQDTVDFIVVSKENRFSIPSTLFFLSKIRCRFTNFKFVENNNEIWEGLDYLITTDPELIDDKTEKKVIKLIRPYNENTHSGIIEPVLQLNDLTENKEFQDLIGYVAPKIEEEKLDKN